MRKLLLTTAVIAVAIGLAGVINKIDFGRVRILFYL